MQKLYVLGGFGYHGNLLVVFGFWCVECQILYVGTLGKDWNVPAQRSRGRGAVVINYTNAQKKGYVTVAGGVNLRRPCQFIPLRREGRDSEELDPGRFQCQH